MPVAAAAARFGKTVQQKAEVKEAAPARAKLPVQPISVDDLLSCESAAGDMSKTGRPRLRRPANATAATASAAPKAAAATSGLPPGWVAMKDEEGDIFYYNESTGECGLQSVFSRPKQLRARASDSWRLLCTAHRR